jgi:hypothetical protein
MVRTSSIIFLSISLLLSVVLPVVTAVVLYRKLRFAWRSVLVGALVFLVFQLITRIPQVQLCCLRFQQGCLKKQGGMSGSDLFCESIRAGRTASHMGSGMEDWSPFTSEQLSSII